MRADGCDCKKKVGDSMFEQMKGLSARKKIEYYIQYYGLVTVIIAAVLAVIVGLAVHFATYQKVVSGILAVNADLDMSGSASPDDFADFLKEHGIDPKRNQILVNSSIFVGKDVDASIQRTNEERIQTLLMSQSADVFFADEAYFGQIASSGYLADLREYLPKETLEKYQDALVYAVDIETGENIAAGLRIDADTPWMRKVGWYRESAVAGLSCSMRSEELAIDILMSALGEK